MLPGAHLLIPAPSSLGKHFSGSDPGGISRSRVWETNAGFSDVKSPVLRCHFRGSFLSPPLSFQPWEQHGASSGSSIPRDWEGCESHILCWGGHPCQACLVQDWQLCGSGVALGFPVLAPPWGVHGTSLGCPSHLSPGLWRKETTARHPELTPKPTLGICTGFYRGCACLSLPGATCDPSAGPWRGTGDASLVCGNIHVLVPCHCPKSSVCSHFPDR